MIYRTANFSDVSFESYIALLVGTGSDFLTTKLIKGTCMEQVTH